jgi:hypothetical protein
MMAEVEAAVDPDAGLVDVDIVLRADGPLPLGGDPFALCSLVRRACGERRGGCRPLRSVCGSWRGRAAGYCEACEACETGSGQRAAGTTERVSNLQRR